MQTRGRKPLRETHPREVELVRVLLRADPSRRTSLIYDDFKRVLKGRKDFYEIPRTSFYSLVKELRDQGRMADVEEMTDWVPWSAASQASCQPFQTSEDIALCLRLATVTRALWGRTLSQREADWAPRLRSSLGALDTFVQWLVLMEYAHRNTAAVNPGQQVYPTDDLDALVSVRPWELKRNGEETLSAVLLSTDTGSGLRFGVATTWPFHVPNLRQWVSRSLGISKNGVVDYPLEPLMGYDAEWVIGPDIVDVPAMRTRSDTDWQYIVEQASVGRVGKVHQGRYRHRRGIRPSGDEAAPDQGSTEGEGL